jgi:hypothetical protein
MNDNINEWESGRLLMRHIIHEDLEDIVGGCAEIE